MKVLCVNIDYGEKKDRILIKSTLSMAFHLPLSIALITISHVSM
jgi:hypothetical protein